MEYFDYFKLIVLPFFISLASVWIIHPHIVKVAKVKGIVDNPNARKLQKEPVPVMGGVAVFFGIFMSFSFANVLAECSELFVLMTSMLLMLYLGSIDDILDLRAISRLIVQVGAVLVLIYIGGDYEIDHMFGLWGIHALPQWVAVPLTVFVAVGIINATNLIDGVDGLSSGFGVMASVVFSVAFFYTGDYPMVILCAATVGSLSLFFLHNVFGKKSKMFIGDGGTLMLGIILAAYVVRLICSAQPLDAAALPNERASVIPFTLAVLSIPVFDTLRVMSTRILTGHSPFHPDKTHLHHMFIDLGFSHVITTVSILSLNTLVIIVWAVACYAGCSADTQTFIVFLTSIACTFGLYRGMRSFRQRSPERYERLREFIRDKQPRRDGWFLTVQKIVDKI